MYNKVRLRHTLKPQAAVGFFLVKAYAAEIVRVVFHYKTLVGVPSAPLMVGHARCAHHLVLPLLPLDRHHDTLVGEGTHALCRYPEHVHHIVCRNLLRFLVHAAFIGFYPARAVGGVPHLVPFLRGKGVGVLQFGKRVKAVPVLLDKFKVRAAALLLGCDILTGETPVLV